ncbi:MAG: prepilin-type N-terminal cleavage/methylation domain-containing protein [bacterium]|nr:prepilin-type N-terminal cleavage/methylation domain-containing protein [bacterium]
MMDHQLLTTRCARAAFTLVELMIVVILMGIISASVIPAIGSVQGMREGAARDELGRMLEVTKARAIASGVPSGLQIDLNESSLTIVHLSDAGAVEELTDPLTLETRSVVLPSVYTGVTLDGFTNGDGAGGSGTIWFNYEATPHTRTSGGAMEATNSSNATIELSSGQQVIVHAYSGVVEMP